MPALRTIGRIAFVLFGVVVLGLLAYDAGAVTRAVGLDPHGQEAGVVLAGLAVAAVSFGLGFWSLRSPRRAWHRAASRRPRHSRG